MMGDHKSDNEDRNQTSPARDQHDDETNQTSPEPREALISGEKRKIVSACSKVIDNIWMISDHISEFYEDECNRFITRKDLKRRSYRITLSQNT